jgi:hypothetical protein
MPSGGLTPTPGSSRLLPTADLIRSLTVVDRTERRNGNPMKKLITAFAGLALAMGLFAGVAGASNHLPLHGHMLVQGLEFGPGGVTYEKCVDLANNQALTLHAHHEAMHVGPAGYALFTHAGHFVVPAAPFSPVRDCAHLAELFGPPTR